MEPTAGERVLLRGPELGADRGLQPGRQVAQDGRGHEQQATEHAGQRQERAAAVLRRYRATVVYVLGHDHRVLYILLELGEMRRVGQLVHVRAWRRTRAVVVRVPLAPAPVS